MSDARTINTTGPVTLQAGSLTTGHVTGDVMLTPRTWVRDLLDAKPPLVILAAWSVGFGLACGGAAGAALIVSLTRLVGRLTGG